MALSPPSRLRGTPEVLRDTQNDKDLESRLEGWEHRGGREGRGATKSSHPAGNGWKGVGDMPAGTG